MNNLTCAELHELLQLTLDKFLDVRVAMDSETEKKWDTIVHKLVNSIYVLELAEIKKEN